MALAERLACHGTASRAPAWMHMSDIRALPVQAAQSLGVQHLKVAGDSMLVVNQVSAVLLRQMPGMMP